MPAIEKNEAIKFGWTNVKSNPKFFIGITIIYILISVAVSMIFDPYLSYHIDSRTTIKYNFISGIINALFAMGFIKICLNYVDGKPTTNIKDIFSGFTSSGKLIFNYILASILYALICIGGLVLLVVPGIIWAIKYSYTLYLVVDKNMSAMDAIKMSGKITNGFKVDLFIFYIILFGIGLLGVICLFLGLFAAIPVIYLANTYIYRQLVQNMPTELK